MSRTIVAALANMVQARLNCLANDDISKVEWAERHEARAAYIVKEYLPSGSGFDNGTTLDFDKSTGEKLVFQTAFHHMNEQGSYDGWTEHTVTVTASLVFGFTLKVSGRNRNNIKDYIAEVFNHELGRDEPVEKAPA